MSLVSASAFWPGSIAVGFAFSALMLVPDAPGTVVPIIGHANENYMLRAPLSKELNSYL